MSLTSMAVAMDSSQAPLFSRDGMLNFTPHGMLNPQPPTQPPTNYAPPPPTIPSTSASAISPDQDSPTSTQSTGSKRKAPITHNAPADPNEDVVVKRQRNTLAARKYRQKRVDQVADLESALGEMTRERDELRLKLARTEAEADALREMMSKK